jgi:hypothetical protein
MPKKHRFGGSVIDKVQGVMIGKHLFLGVVKYLKLGSLVNFDD